MRSPKLFKRNIFFIESVFGDSTNYPVVKPFLTLLVLITYKTGVFLFFLIISGEIDYEADFQMA